MNEHVALSLRATLSRIDFYISEIVKVKVGVNRQKKTILRLSEVTLYMTQNLSSLSHAVYINIESNRLYIFTRVSVYRCFFFECVLLFTNISVMRGDY